MRTTVYDISLGSKKPRQVICTSRVRYMLHKCNRARREHVASNMLFYNHSVLSLDSVPAPSLGLQGKNGHIVLKKTAVVAVDE